MAVSIGSSLPDQVRIWIDGALKSPENAHVSVLDRGFLYGDSVFETLRTYGGQPFALASHIERLAESARRVWIELPLSEEALSEEVSRAVSASGFSECYVRVMVTRGQGALGLDPRQAVEPLRVMLVAPLVPPPASDYREGIRAITYETTRQADDTPAAGAKIGNYLVAVLANRQAAEAGAKEALIMNAQGQVIEGATSNVFWFEGSLLLTPPLSSGILAGITRRHILEVAERVGLSVAEKVPTAHQLLASDGVFISSTIREMLSVVAIDGQQVAGGKVPEAFFRLHAAFREAVGAPPLAPS
jgi:branched-chain amino acid aminotransferase